MTKSELRNAMRARLRTVGDTRIEKSRAITARVVAHPAFSNARTVALFASLPAEPDLGELWLSKGPRRFCFPRVERDRLIFLEAESAAELLPSAWNQRVHEPAHHAARIVRPDEMDLVLVPGLAFTRTGERLGRGGGFYDRLLATLPAHAVKLGVCFDVQLLTDLPLETHDQQVDAVLTEITDGPEIISATDNHG